MELVEGFLAASKLADRHAKESAIDTNRWVTTVVAACRWSATARCCGQASSDRQRARLGPAESAVVGVTRSRGQAA